MSAVVALIPLVLLGLGVLVVLFLIAGIRFIPNNKVGIVEMRISPRGSLDKGVIALKGEAGFQPGLLRGGLHYLLPIQYDVHIVPLVTIPQGKIGYVYARDGQPLPASQVLGTNATASDFQDVADFLQKGGQRGPQRKILREGTYAINLAQFLVITEERTYFLPLGREEDQTFRAMAQVIHERLGFAPVVIKGADDLVGIV